MRSRSIRSSFALSSPLRTMTEVTTAYRSVRQWLISPERHQKRFLDALHVHPNGFLSYLWQPLRELTTNLAADLATEMPAYWFVRLARGRVVCRLSGS